MAKQSKGVKYGRGTRSPSAKLQKMRTDRNKRLKVARHVKRMKKKAEHRKEWETRQEVKKATSTYTFVPLEGSPS